MTSSVTFLCSGKETEFHIDPEMTLELMMAANYLHT
jgi:transcription elongation factor B subunit 1